MSYGLTHVPRACVCFAIQGVRCIDHLSTVSPRLCTAPYRAREERQ